MRGTGNPGRGEATRASRYRQRLAETGCTVFAVEQDDMVDEVKRNR
jgi:nucleoside-triphosphatase THEP1